MLDIKTVSPHENKLSSLSQKEVRYQWSGTKDDENKGLFLSRRRADAFLRVDKAAHAHIMLGFVVYVPSNKTSINFLCTILL